LAFIAGTFVSGTQVFGAAQSGWQAAVTGLEQDLDDLFGQTDDLDKDITAETIARQIGDANVALQANNDITIHTDDSSAHHPAEITLYRNQKSSGASIFGEFVSVEVLCDEGDLATGGGFVAGVPEDRNFLIKRSLPLGNPPTSWFVQGKQIEGTVTDFIIAFVVCIDQTPWSKR